MNTSREKENKWPTYGLRIFLNTISHPFEYAKVLIQIGYEPFPPQPTTTFFGKPALKLPNVLQYVKHIYTVDGFWGCYRGLTPKLCGSIVSVIATQKVIEFMQLERTEEDDSDDEDEETDERRREKFIKNLRGELIIHSIAIISSSSFNVITVRMMSQFVGRETKYTGVFGSISEIYKENGVMGFFAGFVPRLLGDILSVILSSSLAYLINTYIIQEKQLRHYTTAAMSLLSSSIMYPFQVVSNCMAVTDSGLEAGSPPHMPLYGSWLECWSDLSNRNQLKRGSSLLVRYYVPPQKTVTGIGNSSKKLIF